MMSKLMWIFSAVALLCLAGCKKSTPNAPQEPLAELIIGEPVVADIENTTAAVSATISVPEGYKPESGKLSYRIASSPDWITIPAVISPDFTRISGNLIDLKPKTNYYCRFSVNGTVGGKPENGVSKMKSFNTAGIRVELAKAPTQTIKVAVVIEDPIIDGQRFHSWGGWMDPTALYLETKSKLEACSDGVVKIEIVKVIEADRLFTYFREDANKPDRHFTTQKMKTYFVDDYPAWTVIREHERGWNILYDYLEMVRHYGFEQMRDRNEINEVWVISFPINGMFESNFVGKTGKGFWLNSPPTEGASNEKLLTVMGHNYQRGVAEAMHNHGHRLESIMLHLYGRWITMPPGTDYTPGMALNNWEKYTLIDAVAPGQGQIGCTHWPVNAVQNYGYWDQNSTVTYRKSWKYYPDIQNLEEDKEIVSGATWKTMGYPMDNDQGYMINMFKHLPNKAGKNPADGKLNNWWHYHFDYEGAIELQNQGN